MGKWKETICSEFLRDKKNIENFKQFGKSGVIIGQKLTSSKCKKIVSVVFRTLCSRESLEFDEECLIFWSPVFSRNIGFWNLAVGNKMILIDQVICDSSSAAFN